MGEATVSRFFALLSLATLALAVVGLVAALRRESPRTLLRTSGLSLAAAIATTATLGSLYYSEIAGFMPCELCWYQRIAMYPLAVILTVAAVRRDAAVRWYALPLSMVGGGVALWHYVQQQAPALATGACSTDTPCTAVWVEEFGFVTIPFMALTGFLAVTVLVAFARPEIRRSL